MVVRVQSFLELNVLNQNEVDITDTLSTDDDMLPISAAIWNTNRVVFDKISRK